MVRALKDIGDSVRVTHVGGHLELVEREAEIQDVPITIVRSDPNVSHYETFAMLEIERLAKEEKVTRPIIYFHTKGVSSPGDHTKVVWRWTMERYVLDRWRENVEILKGRDAVGFNYWTCQDEHFSGTFWMANADWIRKLPSFVPYHHSNGLVRFSCELWIGSQVHPRCNAYSYGCMNQVTWQDGFNWNWVLPPEPEPDRRITFITAATPSYLLDLQRLQESAKILGNGFSLVSELLEPGFWKHSIKISVMRRMLLSVATDYVFWIDADCEFSCRLLAEDLLHPEKPLSFVRHFAYSNPWDIIPIELQHLLPEEHSDVYYQACLYGGRKEAVAELLDKLVWMEKDNRGYDEHGLNIELAKTPELVHVLPCRYAAPTTFHNMPPDYEILYNERSGGRAKIRHHTRDVTKS